MQALIFDLDGTLVDTVYAHTFAGKRRFRNLGCNRPRGRFIAAWE
jgi:beta-phosphoglucomutase-like phosphatase (HAD superfamily)